MDGLFTVIAVNGNAADILEPFTDSLRYDGLSWSESVELWVLFMFLNQQVYCHLRDGDFPDGSLRLGAGQGEFSVWILDVLLADRDGAVFNIQVGP